MTAPSPAPIKYRCTSYRQAQVVSIVKHGAFENFVQEHTTLLKWIETNDYRIVGAYREIYINHNPANMAESATEIQYPVAKD